MTDTLSPEAKALITVGRGALAPSMDQRARVRARIAAHLAPGAGGGETANAVGQAAGSAGAGVAGKTAIVTLIAALVTGASLGAYRIGQTKRRHDAPAQTARENSTPPPQPVVTLDAPLTEQAETPRQVSPRAAVSPARDRPSEGRGRGLRLELTLLADARAALAGRDATGALVALDRYAEAVHDGQLAREATLLRVQALCLASRADEAQKIEAAARARWPAFAAPCPRKP